MSADRMRDNCAFTSRDQAADWASAFTYAIVFGWGGDEPLVEDCWQEIADRFGWDQELIDWLKRTHAEFEKLGRAS